MREDPKLDKLVFDHLSAVAARQARNHIYLRKIHPLRDHNPHGLVLSLGEHVFCAIHAKDTNLRFIARYPDYLLSGQHCKPIYGENSLMAWHDPPNGIRSIPYVAPVFAAERGKIWFRRGEYIVDSPKKQDVPLLWPEYEGWPTLDVDLRATNSIEYAAIIMILIVRGVCHATIIDTVGRISLRKKCKGQLPDLIGSATAVCNLENAVELLPKYIKYRTALYG